MNYKFSGGWMGHWNVPTLIYYIYLYVWDSDADTAPGKLQMQSLTRCSSGGPEQSQRASKKTWLRGEGAGWCHTGSGTIISFIYSSNQKNRLGTAEYQFILLPEPMSGCLKCHWVGRLCISVTAGLQKALKQVWQATRNCPATFGGGWGQSGEGALAQWGMRAARISD